jgi:hypothetical protein
VASSCTSLTEQKQVLIFLRWVLGISRDNTPRESLSEDKITTKHP